MRVLGLAGSPRARNSITLKLVEAGVAGAAEAGADGEVIEVAHLNIRRCRGCGECFRIGRCLQDDDLSYVLDSMRSADGIILGSPAYAGGVTAPVESLMERMGDVVHCRRLEGRYGFSISVSRDGDESFVLSHMNRFLADSGIMVIGGLGALVDRKSSADEAIVRAGRLGGDLAAAIKEKRRYSEQDEARATFLREFGEAVVSNREKWAFDYRYWSEKGWI